MRQLVVDCGCVAIDQEVVVLEHQVQYVPSSCGGEDVVFNEIFFHIVHKKLSLPFFFRLVFHILSIDFLPGPRYTAQIVISEL